MKKIWNYFIFFLLFIVPIHVGAISYDITDYYVDVTILDNGDIAVKELLVLDGSYNGYIRDLNFKSNMYPDFTGSVEDLKGSSIYNGKRIKDIAAFNLLLPRTVSFDAIHSNQLEDIVVEQTLLSDQTGVSLKMYNASNGGKKGFYIEYVIEDVIVQHDDYAEYYFPILTSNFEDLIQNIEVQVHLPEAASDLRVWGHGTYQGDIYPTQNKDGAVVKLTNIAPRTPVDIRMLFDKDLVVTDKQSHMVVLDDIVKIESALAEEANRLREAYLQEQQQQNMIRMIVRILTYLWYLGLASLIIFVYIKYDKEHKSSFEQDYLREFPADYGPEIVDYLINAQISTNGLSASLLEIVRKKGLLVEENPDRKGDYLFKQGTPKEKLTSSEEFVIDWFINGIGNHEYITLNAIKKASSTHTKAVYFQNKYEEWKLKVSIDAHKEDFFENHDMVKTVSVLYALLALVLLLLNINYQTNSILGYLLFVAMFASIIYFITFKKRTVKGNDHYVKWMAMKKFLNDFGNFSDKELPQIILWEKYLVYATVFGIAKKLEKTMKIKIAQLNPNTEVMNDFTFFMLYTHHFNIASQINAAVNNSVSSAASMALNGDASMTRSSGGGFGGGFSGGGSIGGGFSGGGRGF